MRQVVTASSLGTVFEWYDFFIYGTLAASGIIGRTFFATGNPVMEALYAWAGFAVGFGFRPLGAVLFGYLGDRLGRKYTFLVTITLMGIATAGVGLVPSHASIGVAAPTIVILLRILQGLALGGEYGGAAIYVAEHAPAGRAGYFTSFIQASVSAGFVLSLAVVLLTRFAMPTGVWDAWGWRLPFIFSIGLLAISLYMRLKLSESPVFQAMKSAGEVARNPLKESFTHPGNIRRLFVALFGVAAGLTVIWYTATFSVLSFLQGPMRVEPVVAQLMAAAGAAGGLFWFVVFGKLSDRIGRKKPIVIGYGFTLLMLFPLFWAMGQAANPELADAAKRAPVVVSGPDCAYDPFAMRQGTTCGQLMDYLSKKGIPYSSAVTPSASVSIGGLPVVSNTSVDIDKALANAGYKLDKVVPSAFDIVLILIAISAMAALSGLTYGPVAALLTELFPPRIRYSSMSIPYHIGTGYFGGFLPLISQYMVAKSGNPYAGIWYTWIVVAVALAITLIFLKEKDLKPAG
ncbi:MAG: MFS transporter [Sphingomonas sp.]|nr:MFS transporter [Sphingomonas sp.]